MLQALIQKHTNVHISVLAKAENWLETVKVIIARGFVIIAKVFVMKVKGFIMVMRGYIIKAEAFVGMVSVVVFERGEMLCICHLRHNNCWQGN